MRNGFLPDTKSVGNLDFLDLTVGEIDGHWRNGFEMPCVISRSNALAMLVLSRCLMNISLASYPAIEYYSCFILFCYAVICSTVLNKAPPCLSDRLRPLILSLECIRMSELVPVHG